MPLCRITFTRFGSLENRREEQSTERARWLACTARTALLPAKRSIEPVFNLNLEWNGTEADLCE